MSSRTESGWNFSADFLYWFPSEETSAIWASVFDIGSNTSTWGLPGFDFTWDYGFRLGTGYNFSYDQWDSSLAWTWFRTEQEHTIPKTPTTFISPEFDAAFLSGNNAQSLTGRWSLLFNTFDWELGRSYWVSKNLSLRPCLGVKAGAIFQSISAHYSNLIISGVLTHNAGEEHVKNNFWGVGPLGGINTKWQVRCFGSHFLSFFGDFLMATLWGNWTCSDQYENTTSQTFSVKTKNSSLGALMVRGFLGAIWDINFSNKSHFAAKLGFETQFWMNQLRIATLQVQRLHGDLTLQGLTLSGRYDY